ncbi:heterokaryon incompatibility protein-domain-containing protein [Pyrenochaeta sp. MPI-SDFR-AT-0127]|nr:heterokaryon incompatibility protein-domain-containing protein [Pyrenochaeta sp. MPI-SDFR-AT-0127]
MDPGSMTKPTSGSNANAAYCYSSFDYSLPQIRLLTLLPSRDKTATIRAGLEIVTSLKSPAYEALSYTWGDQTNTHALLIGDEELRVSQNLFDALCQLRSPSDPRILWVDAVCINQNCPDEKNHQVRQMYNIYSNASRVLIWLGKGNNDSDYAMENLEGSDKPTMREKYHGLDVMRIGKLFHRSWWTRMWTLQEALAAGPGSMVLCGNKSASWEAVNRTLENLSVLDIFGTPNTHSLPNATILLYFNMIRVHRANGEKVILANLLLSTADRDASDPRDRIYALLGLVSDPRLEELEPDYSKSALWVYQKAMISIFKSRKDLDWLLYAIGEGTSLQPSWCVDFSTNHWLQHPGAPRQWIPRDDPKDAGATTGREIFELCHDPDSGTIKQTGTVVGRIKIIQMPTCGAVIEGVNPEEGKSARDEAMVTLLEDMMVFTRTAIDAWEERVGRHTALSKVMAGDVWKAVADGQQFNDLVKDVANVEPNVNGYAFLAEFLAVGMSGEGEAILQQYPLKEIQIQIAMTACIRTVWNIKRRCFFTTDTHYIGMASRNIQAGDLVCILFGCKFPVVLRPCADGVYKLVTVAYTDDIMEGEFLKNANSIEEKDFLIR